MAGDVEKGRKHTQMANEYKLEKKIKTAVFGILRTKVEAHVNLLKINSLRFA